MRKILLINPPSRDEAINRDMAGGLGYSAGSGVVLAPLDLLTVATTLRRNGYKIFFKDAIAEKLFDFDWVGYIKQHKIEILIGSLALPTIDEDVSFYGGLKEVLGERLKIFIKTGINYPKIIKEIERKTKADGVITWECDLNIADYLLGKPISKEMVENLDLLPIPARDLVESKRYRYTLLPGSVATIQTSRGCPYGCSYYCPYPLVQGKRWRPMSPERVIESLVEIKRLGYESVLFRDATFTLDMNRAMKICELMVRNKTDLKWWCETRINVLSRELLERMKKAGCVGINVGVETMDEDLIKTEGKPGVSVGAVIQIRRWAKELGVKLHFLMIVGLPNDTVGGLYKTFKYLVRLRPESIGFSLITPYPGTEMFEDSLKSGLIENFEWDRFRGDVSNMRTKYMSRKELVLGRRLLMVTSFSMKRLGGFGRAIIWMVDIYFRCWICLKKFW